MIPKLLAVVSISVVTSGCTTMLAHQKLSEENTQTLAGATAYVAACSELGYIDELSANQFYNATSNLLSVSVYDTETLETGFSQYQSHFYQLSQEEKLTACQDNLAYLPKVTNLLANLYASIAQTRRNQLNAMSQSFSELGNSFSSASNGVARPMPSYTAPQPTFGISKQAPMTQMYNASDCIGSNLNGNCYGTVLPSTKPVGQCLGAVVLGECKGTMMRTY